MHRLPLLDAEIATTVARVLDAQPNWPCRRGCDHCCRSLATPMRISRAEWERLDARLDGEARARVMTAEPRVCPLLDDSGACTVYEVRPIECRSYGFYAGRDGGAWCAIIEESAVAESVVVGNHDALKRALDALGEKRTLREWLDTTSIRE